MNKERLLELADHLDSLPRHRFDMASFYARWSGKDRNREEVDFFPEDDSEDADRPTNIAKEVGGSCNTSACIAGWAVALHPRAGSRDTQGHWRSSYWGGNYWYYAIDEHAQSILGLSEVDARRLFYEDLNQTPKQAARKIRKTVELGYVPEAKV